MVMGANTYQRLSGQRWRIGKVGKAWPPHDALPPLVQARPGGPRGRMPATDANEKAPAGGALREVQWSFADFTEHILGGEGLPWNRTSPEFRHRQLIYFS
jgi:hypothetical protein